MKKPSCPTCREVHLVRPVSSGSKVLMCENCLHRWQPHRELSNPARIETGWINIILSVN